MRDGEIESSLGEAPPEGTLERWAFDYVTSRDLTIKRAPPPPPKALSDGAAKLRIARPGRPPELSVTWDKYKAPKTAGQLVSAEKRAHLLHTFWHHELQAAELMCWALLSFPDTPEAFRRGLVAICLDEIRHMSMYERHIERLGFAVGVFPVRDWFWERAPSAPSALAFVALMGLGFEAGNLDHAERFALKFRDVGDHEGAELQALVGREEVRHVAFGAHWFRLFAGELTFARWLAALPPPLSPSVMRGTPLQRAAREAAGIDHAFLDELEAWQPVSRGS